MNIVDKTLDITKRLGTFCISEEIMLKNPEAALQIFSKCIIVRAEFIFHKRSIEYVAYSYLFEELDDGSCPKEYGWIVEKESNGKIEVKLVDSQGVMVEGNMRRKIQFSM